MDSQNASSTTPLCVKGCGFFGSAENRNMCSKCYKDYLLHELIAKARSVETVTQRIETHEKSLSIPVDSEKKPDEASSKPKNRCESCKKKVGFTGITCRCGKLLCGMHRYPENHSCTFDFKKAGRQILAKQSVLVKADKLDDRI